ncbi:MAG: hypothetical protein ACTSW1_13330 [Candidatus Hodarchaeales archaeon]
MSENNDDWIEGLIKLGIGALAVYFLVKILSKKDQDSSSIDSCPYCGAPIKKWAVVCPSCRRRIRSTPIT